MSWRSLARAHLPLWLASLAMAAISIAPSPAAPLRLGTETDDAPFSSIDAQGNAGFSIDVGNEICKRLRLHCQWIGLRFNDLIPALLANRIDAAISQITVTPARSTQVMFTKPLTETGGILIVPETSEITNKPASMKGKTIAVQSGTTHQTYAEQVIGNVARVALYPTQAQAFAALVARRADATLCDMDLGYAWLEAHSGSFRFADRPIADPAHYGSQTAIALRPGSTALQKQFDRAIDAMMHDGSFAAITKKYFTFSIAPGAFGNLL